MNIINKILFILIAIIYMGCNEEPASSNSDDSSNSNSTLGDSNISGHDAVGNIDDYFYDFDEVYTPYVNSKFNRYSGTTLLFPISFDPNSDTLNFSSVTDYVLSFNLQDGEYNSWDDFVDVNENGVWDEGIDELVEYGLTDEMIELAIFDETGSGDCSIGSCSDGTSITSEDCCLNNPYFQCNGEGEYLTLEDCISDDSNGCESVLCLKAAGSDGPIYEVNYDDDLNMWVSVCKQSPSEWTPNNFDLNQNGLYEYNEWIDLNGNGDVWDDCPDLNYDQQLTQGKYENIYRQEEIKFNHVYADVLKLEWDNDNDRYVIVSFPGACGQLEYKEYLGDPADAGNPGLYPDIQLNNPSNSQVSSQDCDCIYGEWIWNQESESEDSDDALGFCRLNEESCSLFNGSFLDPDCDGYGMCILPAIVHENAYDSTTYITKINTNNVNGFFNYTDSNDNGQWDDAEPFNDNNNNGVYDDDEDFADLDGNGQWNDAEAMGEGEDYQVGNSGYGQFYFDQTELVKSDSIYTSEVIAFEHSFTYPKKIVSTDALMYLVSTDCNDNGSWDDKEDYTDSEPNGVCDGDETWIDVPNGVYDVGESFVDAIKNGVYDEGEDFVDGNGVYDEGEPFIDAGNGQYDEGEILPYQDGNGVWDQGESFTDVGNGIYDEGEEFTDAGNGQYDEAEEFSDDNNNGQWDDGEDFVDENLNGEYDLAEEFIDSGNNGIWDDGEEFTDALNGVWDFYIDIDGDGRCEPEDGDECEEFEDEQNGEWDEGELWNDLNGVYDEGEEFADVNGNGIRDAFCNVPELSWNSNFDTESSCETAGDSWQSEEFIDSLNGYWDEGETFVDGNGIYNSPEPYIDENGNGSHDYGEECTDLNNNGQWDDGEPYTDDNNNGQWDDGEEFIDENGVWDFYLDNNGNGSCEPEDGDECEEFVDAGNSNGIYDDGEGFFDINGSGVWDDYCMDDNQGWNDDYLTENSCVDAGHDWILEDFSDGNGIWDEGEEFTDALNGVWDPGEPLVDEQNGQWDEGETWVDINGEYNPGEEFVDSGSNGIYDEGEDFIDVENGWYDGPEEFTDENDNGQWDQGEEFVDANLNDEYDEGEEFIDGNLRWDEGEEFVDALNGVWDGPEFFIDENENGVWDWNDIDGDNTCDLQDLGVECELFVDTNDNGVWDQGEVLVDDKQNGRWDEGEDFVDEQNGQWDEGEDFVDGNGVWDEGESFTDSFNGVWDEGEEFVDTLNGTWNEGEDFTDSVGDGKWNEGESFIDGNKIWDPGEEFTDALNGIWDFYTDTDGNGICDVTEPFVDTNNNGTWDCNFDFDNDGVCEPEDGDICEQYTDVNGNGIWDEYDDECEDWVDLLNGVWDLHVDVDGDGRCEPDDHEPFNDTNGNGEYNDNEPFTDQNNNGRWDAGDQCEYLFDTKNGVYDEDEAFNDINGNGVWDSYCMDPYGDYCDGEIYVTQELCESEGQSWVLEEFYDGNGYWDEGEDFIDMGNGIWDEGEEFTDDLNGVWDFYIDIDGDGRCDLEDGDQCEDHIDDLNDEWDLDIDNDGDGRCEIEDGDRCEELVDLENGVWDFYTDVDGDGRCELDDPEDYIDINSNGEYDNGEPFTDQNNNDVWDAGDGCEVWVDVQNGVYDSPEPFTDCNFNGVWDSNEDYEDLNKNNVWDAGEEFTDKKNEIYDTPEPFVDCNDECDDCNQLDLCMCEGDAEWESYMGNGKYDYGEDYTDENGNGTWDGEEFVDFLNGIYDEGEEFTDGNGVWDFHLDNNSDGVCDPDDGDICEEFTDGNGIWDEGEEFIDDFDGAWNFYVDMDGDGRCDVEDGDICEEFTDLLDGVWNEGEEFFDDTNNEWDFYLDNNGDGICNPDDGDLCEEFTDSLDGIWNEGEEFTDGNGIWDFYLDNNGDGICDPDDGDLCEEFTDGNEIWDEGEEFTDQLNGEWDFYVDMDGDGRCEPEDGDQCEEFTDSQNGEWDEDEELFDVNGNETHDYYCSQAGLAWDSSLNNLFSCDNAGYEWVVEDFIDGNGIYDEGEEFIDGNGVRDNDEEFTDALNGFYDGPEYYDDINSSGELDYVCMCGVNYNSIFVNQYNCELNSCIWMEETYADINNNGQWDSGEEFIDIGGNSIWDEGEEFTDVGNGIPDSAEPFVDSFNGTYDIGEDYIEKNDNGYWDSYCASEIDGTWNSELPTQDYCEFYDGYEWIEEEFTDALNGIYDIGEDFTDLNGNGQWDDAEFTDIGNEIYDVGEPFVDIGDGIYDVGEPFIDAGDGQYNEGELFIDIGDGVWNDAEPFTDIGNGIYDEGEEFVDLNENCQYDDEEVFIDIGNGVYDEGEEYVDLNENGEWDAAEEFTDSAQNGIWDEGEEFTDSTNNEWDFYLDINGDGMCDPDYAEEYTDENGNGQWDEGEEFTDINENCMWDNDGDICEEFVDKGNGKWNHGEDYTDRGNGQWDPAEPFFNYNGNTSNNAYTTGSSYLDRNCNEQWDRAEYRSDNYGTWDEEMEEFNEVNCDEIGGEWIDASGYSFCDLGNGRWDHAEGFTDSETGEYIQSPHPDIHEFDENNDWLYEISNKAETLMASYSSDGSWVAYEILTDTTTIYPRFFDFDSEEDLSGISIIETIDETITKTKEITKVDSIVSIYSYNLVENMLTDYIEDYNIAKTVWYESGDRQANYHLYRKDEDSQNIVELTHKSYFSLPSGNASEIIGSEYDEYLLFDEYPSEEILFYTYGGLLRDGEHHEINSTIYSADTFAEYDVYETYDVSYEPAEMTYGNGIYDIGEEFTDEENGVYDIGEEYSDFNANGVRDFYCKQEGAWNTYTTSQLNIGNYNDQVSCEAASHSWVSEPFIDGNGVWDEGEEFSDAPVYIQDTFKITRVKRTVMIGSGLEITEQNNTWLSKGKGIVKDEVSFKFNDLIIDGEVVGGDDYDGFYRLEVQNCRHCEESEMYRASNGIFDERTDVNFNQLNMTGDFNDDYKKIRTYGIQQISTSSDILD